MASTETRTTETRTRGEIWQPAEKWQQSTDQLQKSTSAMWRRSASALSESKDRCHQSTMETYHRSADSWSESKERCRQSTLEMMNRSADSWSESKHRCRQSTLDMIHRSTTRWAQSAARMQQKQRQALLKGQKSETSESPESATVPTPNPILSQRSQPLESTESDQPPPPQDSVLDEEPHTSQTAHDTDRARQPQGAQQNRDARQPQPSQSYSSSQASESVTSSPTETKPPTRTRATSLPSWKSLKDKQKPEDQARALFESMDQIVAQVVHAKHLKDSRTTEMGEIEYNWVHSIITNTETSARSLARILQTYRQDMAKNKGKISSSNRKSWKNKDFLNAEEKQAHLLVQRDQLEKVIVHLQNPKTPSKTSSSPVESPCTPDEPTIETIVELPESTPVLVAELPADQQIIELDTTSVVAELSSEPTPKAEPFIAELSEDAAIIRRPVPSVPKIVVTGAVDSPAGTLESPKRTDLSYEVHEINEMLKKTRTDTREQQSESLSNIVARMETTRAR